jgi:GNAT superfamily N-acetyltransferase
MPTIAIRAADADDTVFLTSMLITAMTWVPDDPASPAAVLADAQVWQYIAEWPRPGDHGLVAVDEQGRPQGACWLRYRTARSPGFGFVAPDVPELTIAVRSGARRMGIGRALLQAMAEQARSRGVTRLSLNVEHGNPAARLYRSEGWRTVEVDADAETMTLDLGVAGAPALT